MNKKKTVKLGLYGCGNRTRMLLEALEGEDEYKVVSAFDIREESTKNLCEKFGGKICHSAEEMLGAKGVEAVLISLNPFAHAEAFFKTLKLKIPIFIEKPIASTAKEAFQMMQSAKAEKVPVHVGLIHRYYHAYKAAKRHLEENDPGVIFSMVYNWQHAGETEMINCHNMFPGNFRLKISQIPYHCCHALDLYHVFVGEITSVYAYGIKKLDRDYVSPDEVIALFEFKNGAIGHFHYSSVCKGRECAYPAFINTENYSLSCSPSAYVARSRPPHKSMRGELKKEDCRATWFKHVGPVSHKYELNHYGMATAELMNDFLESVRNGSPMKVPIEEGYRVAQLAEAIELSYKQGKKINLPLKF